MKLMTLYDRLYLISRKIFEYYYAILYDTRYVSYTVSKLKFDWQFDNLIEIIVVHYLILLYYLNLDPNLAYLE